jgi:hypothetical protein
MKYDISHICYTYVHVYVRFSSSRELDENDLTTIPAAIANLRSLEQL